MLSRVIIWQPLDHLNHLPFPRETLFCCNLIELDLLLPKDIRAQTILLLLS